MSAIITAKMELAVSSMVSSHPFSVEFAKKARMARPKMHKAKRFIAISFKARIDKSGFTSRIRMPD
jgi:hypothetical protein